MRILGEDIAPQRRAHGVELAGHGAHGRRKQRQQKQNAEPARHGVAHVRRDDGIGIPLQRGARPRRAQRRHQVRAHHIQRAIRAALDFHLGRPQHVVERCFVAFIRQAEADEPLGPREGFLIGGGRQDNQLALAIRAGVQPCRLLHDPAADGFLLREIDVGERAHGECHAGHEQNKHASGYHRAVQRLLGFDRHEPHDQLRLGQHPDAHAHHDGAHQNPPQVIFHRAGHGSLRRGEAELGHGRPALVADRLQEWRHLVVHGAQRLVRRGHAAQPAIGGHQQDDHPHQHDAALEGIGHHDALEAAGNHIGRHNQRKNIERAIVADVEDGADEFCAADHHGHGVERHEAEDNQRARHLQKAAVVALGNQLGERVRIHVVAHAARRVAQKHKRHENTHADIQHRQPQQPHAEVGRHAAEPHNGRRADERGPVRQRHHRRVRATPRHQIIRGILGLDIAQIAQIARQHQIQNHQDNGQQIHGRAPPLQIHAGGLVVVVIRLGRLLEALVPMDDAIAHAQRGAGQTQHIRQPNSGILNAQDHVNLLGQTGAWRQPGAHPAQPDAILLTPSRATQPFFPTIFTFWTGGWRARPAPPRVAEIGASLFSTVWKNRPHFFHGVEK